MSLKKRLVKFPEESQRNFDLNYMEFVGSMGLTFPPGLLYSGPPFLPANLLCHVPPAPQPHWSSCCCSNLHTSSPLSSPHAPWPAYTHPRFLYEYLFLPLMFPAQISPPQRRLLRPPYLKFSILVALVFLPCLIFFTHYSLSEMT